MIERERESEREEVEERNICTNIHTHTHTIHPHSRQLQQNMCQKFLCAQKVFDAFNYLIFFMYFFPPLF